MVSNPTSVPVADLAATPDFTLEFILPKTSSELLSGIQLIPPRWLPTFAMGLRTQF